MSKIVTLEELEEDQSFLEMFHGKDTSFGNGDAWRSTFKYLNDKDMAKKAYCCMVFFMKPKNYLLHGTTKSKPETSTPIDQMLLKYLPRAERTTEDLQKIKRDGEAVYLNYQMISRVALISLSFGPSTHKFVKGWTSRYGNKPCDMTEANVQAGTKNYKVGATKEENPANESATILWTQIQAFKNQKVFWIDMPWSQVLQGKGGDLPGEVDGAGKGKAKESSEKANANKRETTKNDWTAGFIQWAATEGYEVDDVAWRAYSKLTPAAKKDWENKARKAITSLSKSQTP